ncbi:cytochrome P450 [Pseudonocardiaceae bacterium YIM PH 21723]|nr:cytochrome P450 [Pseudonocardiaceae bacterium YIM PH 21723]
MSTSIHSGLFSAEYMRDPYPVYREMRDAGPVHETVGSNGVRVWVITDYAEARAALADPRLAKDSVEMGEVLAANRIEAGLGWLPTEETAAHMLNSDPPDHGRLRRLVSRGFTGRRVQRLRGRIEELSAGLIDRMAARTGPVDLLADYALPLPMGVIGELVGWPESAHGPLREWTSVLMASGTTEDITRASLDMTGYLRELVAHKREHPADDLLSALLEHDSADGTLGENELIAMLVLLVIAGHDTTVNLIATGMRQLLRHPDQLALLRADRSLLPGAIEEFLRIEGPVINATARYTSEPVIYGGVPIPAGQVVLVALTAANHDPARYPDPGRLDITRSPGGHLGFGHGIHFCLGAPLARLEAEIAFTQLLDRFGRIELAVPDEDLEFRTGMVIRGIKALPVNLGT